MTASHGTLTHCRSDHLTRPRLAERAPPGGSPPGCSLVYLSWPRGRARDRPVLPAGHAGKATAGDGGGRWARVSRLALHRRPFPAVLFLPEFSIPFCSPHRSRHCQIQPAGSLFLKCLDGQLLQPFLKPGAMDHRTFLVFPLLTARTLGYCEWEARLSPSLQELQTPLCC